MASLEVRQQVNVSDRVVLITGATGPLGRVVAATFAAAGARLGLVGTDAGRLAALGAELGLDADRWVAATGDLRQPNEARAAVTAVTERFGAVDILLHLVGGWIGGTPVVRLDPTELQTMLDQHLWTTLHMTQACLPKMVERGWGRVLAVSSPTAVEPAAKGASYSIGKAAEEVLLRTIAREVASAGVTVNVLTVVAIDAKHERERTPTPKNASWATPQEIAGSMLFLCSDAAAAINGARIPLHGRS